MNPIIKKQLEQVKVADLSNYDENTKTYTIPKYTQVRVLEGESYVIKLEDNLIKPNPGDNFHINWNKGSTPNSKFMLVEISKVNGKFIYVYGVEYNLELNTTTDKAWYGWLPLERVTIVKGM